MTAVIPLPGDRYASTLICRLKIFGVDKYQIPPSGHSQSILLEADLGKAFDNL